MPFTSQVVRPLERAVDLRIRAGVDAQLVEGMPTVVLELGEDVQRVERDAEVGRRVDVGGLERAQPGAGLRELAHETRGVGHREEARGQQCEALESRSRGCVRRAGKLDLSLQGMRHR